MMTFQNTKNLKQDDIFQVKHDEDRRALVRTGRKQLSGFVRSWLRRIICLAEQRAFPEYY